MNLKEMKKKIKIKINIILLICLLFNFYVNCADCPSYSNSASECIDSLEDCILKGLKFYNREELKCYASLPFGTNPPYFKNEDDREDEGGNTYTRGCKSSYFPKFTPGTNICKVECDYNEFYTSSKPNECLSSCPSGDGNEYFIYNKECVTECPYFYIEKEDNKKECVFNCKAENGKFFFRGDKKCYDSCEDGNHKFFNSENNECLDTCLNNTENNNKFSYKNNDNSPKECLDYTNTYYDDDYYILGSCNGDEPYISKSDNMKCVTNCINYIDSSNNIKIVGINSNTCEICSAKYEYTDPDNIKCLTSCSSSQNSLKTPEFRTNNQFKTECLDQCPDNYIADNDSKCTIIKCPEGKGQDGSECKVCINYIVEDVNGHVVCQNSCVDPKPFIKDITDKECTSICPEYNNVIVSTNTCGKFCDPTQYIKKASTQPSGNSYTIYECSNNCNGQKFVKEDVFGRKENCFDECPARFQFISNSNIQECLQECPTNQKYYNALVKVNNNYYTCSNSNHCESSNPIYCKGNCYTENQCYANEIYYIDNKECVDNCSGKFRKKTVTGGVLIECTSACDSEQYRNGLECLQVCPRELNFINNNECKNECKDTNGAQMHYKFFEDVSSEHNYQIFECVSSCPDVTVERDYKCLESCPEEIYQSGQICYKNCFLSSNKFSLKTIANQVGQCLASCSGEYKYYYDTDQECLNQCKNGDYADKNTNKCVKDCKLLGDNYYFYENNDEDGAQKKFCVTSCPGAKSYLYDNTCVESCGFEDSEKRYIGEPNKKVCLTDCSSGYPYYIIKNKDTNNEYYECLERCSDESGYPFYAPNSNSAKKGKLCLETCDHNSPKYKYKLGGDKCYEKCPDNAPYSRINIEEDNTCYENCPANTFHEKNDQGLESFICKDFTKCNHDYVDEVTKLCLRENEKCPDGRKVSFYESKYVCLGDCKSPYGVNPTEYNTCVNDCQNNILVNEKNLNLDNQNCVCKNLFYLDGNERSCFAGSISSCKNTADYKFNIYNQNECVNVCDNNRILSLNDEICFPPSFTCSSHVENTVIIERTDGIKKCDCENKYYLNTDTNLKTCFNGECDNGYNQKYVPEIKRCMKNGESCPEDFKHIFLDKYCLRQCPSGSTEATNGNEVKCECKGTKPFWRIITENSYECMVRCPLLYIASTSQCVDSCPSDFSIFHDFKCFASCENSDNLDVKDGVPVPLQNSIFSSQTCDCESEKKWYKEGNTKYCVNSCFEGAKTFNYEVFPTGECVDECHHDNYYTFNEYCYHKCEDNALLKTNEPYKECQCKYGWYYTNDEKTRRQCLYSDQTCISININKDYLIDSTKECVQECPEYLYEFNHVCYDVCPENTIDHISDDGNYCSCNLNDGYWYEYLEYGFTFTSCGLEECPEYEKEDGTKVKMNLIENEKKCVKSCKTDGGEDYQNYYAFKNICVKDCPILTKTNNADDECSFYDLTLEAGIINNKDKFKDAANIQTNELYAKDDTSYNKFGFSFDIYPIDDTSKRAEAINSKKTYIDFSSCLARIYLDKNITDPENILIAKYDLLPEANINIDKNNDKYLINPVEYELFSSSDTNERMDALVCEPNEIVVSYPLCLDKFDRKEGDVDQNEFRDKFDLGKKLYEDDNSIDTFNFNNTIYKDFCRGLEIDGKDLVFEDRYKYLYPYNKILCESNCTLNNTDFELERVNCLCAYKGDFDFYRKEYETNDIFNDQNYFIPSQSGANAEAIKCLFNFSFSQATVKNEAFYCCFLITAVEVVLLFINIVYGIKGVSDNIKKSLNKLNDLFRKNKNNQNKNGNIITTDNRPLNNPPRKKDYEEEKDIRTDNDNMTSESYDKKSGNSDVGAYKWECIPFDYISKFFKQNEYGVLKKIERSKIPFKINPDTKYLVDKRIGGDSECNYLILTDSNANNNDINQLIKYIKDEKINKNKYEPKTKKRVNLIEDSKNNENIKKINDKNLIKVKKLNPINNQEKTEDWTIDDLEQENGVDVDSGNASCITLIRREQLFLRINYEKYIAKKHPSNAYIFFAEILDKIYLVKIILFLGKYDIFFIQLSLYLFCYLLLLSLICGFFTIKVIKKIWEKDNYPNINFYLLYGLISHIILWIIYKIFLYLLDCSDKIKELLLLKKALKEEDFVEELNDNSDEKNQNIINKKYKEQASHMRFRIFIFYLLMFAIIIFCTIYLISFFSIYTGTKKKVFTAFFISLFEILLIKIVYGLCLASLRLASKVNKMKSLYNLVYIFDKFIS